MTLRVAVFQLVIRVVVLQLVIFGAGWAVLSTLEELMTGVSPQTTLGTGLAASRLAAAVAAFALGLLIYIRRELLASIGLLATGIWYLVSVLTFDNPAILDAATIFLPLAGILSLLVKDKPDWGQVREIILGSRAG